MIGRVAFEACPYRCKGLEKYTKRALLSMQRRLRGEEFGEGWTAVVSSQRRKVRDFLVLSMLQCFSDRGFTSAILTGRDLVSQHLENKNGYLAQTHAVGILDVGEERGMEPRCVKQLVFERQRSSLFTVVGTEMTKDWFGDIYFKIGDDDKTEIFFSMGKWNATR